MALEGTTSPAMLSSEVLKYADRAVLAWLATVDATGCPNVSPKEIFATVEGQYFVIANIASPTSIQNILRNPLICLSFIDVFVQKGFKVKGTAKIVTSGDEHFERWAARLKQMAGTRFRFHSVIVVEPSEICEIVAPSYTLYPGQTTEQSQYDAAKQVYNSLPRPEGNVYPSDAA